MSSSSPNSYLITFYTTSQALRLEKEVKKNNLKAQVIPVPRELSSSCGLALRVETEEKRLLKLLEELTPPFDYLYQSRNGGYREVIEGE